MDDRSFEAIRQEALSLDHDSQRSLADALEENLAGSRENDPAFIEAKRRIQAMESGEMKTVDLHEAMARVRNLIKR